MSGRKKPILIRQGAFGGQWFALTNYREKRMPDSTYRVVASENGKHDITAEMEHHIGQAKKDEAANIYEMAWQLVKKRPASAIIAGGTDLDELMNQLERKYGKDHLRHAYGDHNKETRHD